jgi:hypothetical protein
MLGPALDGDVERESHPSAAPPECTVGMTARDCKNYCQANHKGDLMPQ